MRQLFAKFELDFKFVGSINLNHMKGKDNISKVTQTPIV